MTPGDERASGGKGEREIKGVVNLHPLIYLISLSLLMILGGACAPPPTPEEQRAHGEALYQSFCASCHEIDQGIGPRLTKEVIATRVTALALFTYTQKNMPYNAGNTLQENEYWAITAYLLARDSFIETDVVLDAKSAEGLMLEE